MSTTALNDSLVSSGVSSDHTKTFSSGMAGTLIPAYHNFNAVYLELLGKLTLVDGVLTVVRTSLTFSTGYVIINGGLVEVTGGTITAPASGSTTYVWANVLGALVTTATFVAPSNSVYLGAFTTAGATTTFDDTAVVYYAANGTSYSKQNTLTGNSTFVEYQGGVYTKLPDGKFTLGQPIRVIESGQSEFIAKYSQVTFDNDLQVSGNLKICGDIKVQ